MSLLLWNAVARGHGGWLGTAWRQRPVLDGCSAAAANAAMRRTASAARAVRAVQSARQSDRLRVPRRSQASRAAELASPQPRLDWPRAPIQPSASSGSASSNERPDW